MLKVKLFMRFGKTDSCWVYDNYPLPIQPNAGYTITLHGPSMDDELGDVVVTEVNLDRFDINVFCKWRHELDDSEEEKLIEKLKERDWENAS
jgi:hypothetical protein